MRMAGNYELGIDSARKRLSGVPEELAHLLA
jgi:hypothetical protein